ncbi:MAG: hypothetical protein ACOYI8_10855 [Christensenellales bacterium]|jgi:hypothetical protein
MEGPINTLLWLTEPVRPWCLSVFCERETTFEQFYSYTLTKRLRWPKLPAKMLAWLLSVLEPPLLHSAGAIPVYRNGVSIMQTYRKTLQALRKGENIIIFPDVNYTDMSSTVGELYDGYLLLHRLYLKETGKALPFVPIAVDRKRRRIISGKAVFFDGMGNFASQMKRTSEQIVRSLQELADVTK